MATYNVTAQTRRVQFTGNGTAGPFAFSFQVNATSEIKVYVDSAVKTESSHYTVSLNAGTGAGSVSFTSGNHPTSSQTITILGSIPLSRTSVYTSGGQLTASSLEDDFDTNMFVHQQTNEEIDRSLRLAEHDVISGADMTLPVKDTRKGTVLGFNATTGNPEAGPSITSVQSLANVTTAINLLGTSAVVEDLGILGTTAIVEDMALLGTSSNVTAMGLLGVSSVITDMSILGTSAIVEDMGILATSANVTAMGVLGTSANVTAMGKLGNDATVADMALLGTDAVVADMAQLANSTIIDDLAILANSTITDDMAILATSANVTAMGILGTSSNVTAMGLLGTSAVVEDLGLLATSAVIEDMGLLATSAVIEDMGILATSSNVTAMANVSGSITNVNTVASNLSGVNSFAERYRVQSGVPSSNNDVGDLVFDTATNTLKVFSASGFQNAGSSVNGTSARFHYDISGTPTTVSGSDANGNTLAYDAGFVDVYVNGVRMSPADITVTSGSSVVFASALADSDEVDIIAFGTFSLASMNASNLDSGTIASARVSGAYTGITSVGTLTNFRSTGIDDNADALAITIDSSENVMVSKTSADNTTEGHVLYSSGLHTVVKDGGTVQILNRLSSDGTIVDFRKASTSIGSIGTEGTYGSGPQILGSNSRGLVIVNPNTSVNEIIPNVDTVGKLGNSSNRWADLYLSGGVFLGGTGSANKLSDVETGTWTPSITAYTGSQPTVTHASNAYLPSGYYTKVGRLVSVNFYIPNFSVSGTTSGIMLISGLPFATTTSGSWNGGVLSAYLVTFARGTNGNMSLRTFGSNTMGILSSDNGGTWGWELVSIFSGGNARYISGSLTYQADA